MKNLLFVDAETDGLYGTFISVAVVVTDANANEIERFYYGINKKNLKVTDAWTREHVLPILGDYEECEDETELLEKVWAVWEHYRADAYAVADVIYPVEARLFSKCVMNDMERRMFAAPYPLIDLSSLLLAKGIDPNISRDELVGSTDWVEHNAMSDVETSIKIYKKIMEEEK